MSGTAVETAAIPEDMSGQMLELDEDEDDDLEVFSKVNNNNKKGNLWKVGQGAERKTAYLCELRESIRAVRLVLVVCQWHVSKTVATFLLWIDLMKCYAKFPSDCRNLRIQRPAVIHNSVVVVLPSNKVNLQLKKNIQKKKTFCSLNSHSQFFSRVRFQIPWRVSKVEYHISDYKCSFFSYCSLSTHCLPCWKTTQYSNGLQWQKCLNNLRCFCSTV